MSWVEGLLGAVMGGAQEYGTILKEEETAKRKEEEEKRREERALTLAERQEAAREARKAAQEKAKMERIASYLGPAGGATPSQSPMEPEGGGVTEYQIPAEQRLVRGQEAALAKGDVETAKLFNDQYRAIMQEQRAQAKEGREQDEFLRGPKPKEPVGEVAFAKYAAERTYRGPRDAEGKPDPVAFAEHEAGILNRMIEKKTQLRPERGAGNAAGPKPLSMAAEDVAQERIRKMVSGLATDQVGKTKVKNAAKENILGQELADFQRKVAKENPDDPQAFYRIDLLEVERELRGRLKSREDAATAEAGSKFTEYRAAKKAPNETNEQFKARKEAILPNELHRRYAEDKKSTKDAFVEVVKDDFLSSATKSQTAKPATKIVTDGGKQYTVRMAPDGKYYREENGKFFEYKGP